MVSNRAKVSALIRKEDAERSSADWKKLDTTSLRLKCNEYNVDATGKKDSMVERLIEYFSNQPSTSREETSSDSDSSEHEQALDLTVGDDVNTITDDTNETTASSKRKLQHQNPNKRKDGGDSDNNKKNDDRPRNDNNKTARTKIKMAAKARVGKHHLPPVGPPRRLKTNRNGFPPRRKRSDMIRHLNTDQTPTNSRH